MLGLSSGRRYFLYRGNTDMRKGYDGLSGLVREQLRRDPLSGEIFVFISKRRNHLKLLLWEGDGFALYSKRLEAGTFELPQGVENSVEIKSSALVFILEGVKLSSVKLRRRFSMPGLSTAAP